MLRRTLAKARRDGPLRTAVSVLAYIVGSHRIARIADPVVSAMGEKHELHGVTVPLDHDRIDDTIQGRFLTGDYESAERWLIDRYLPRDLDVVELGGGLGFVSCYVDVLLDADRTQVVVEADDDLVDVIRRIRDLNDGDFTISHRAYDPERDVVGFRRGEIPTTGSVATDGAEIEVPAVSLAELVSEFDLEEFSLIADVEGAESTLVAEELAVLKQHCRALVIEYHHPNRRRNPEIDRTLRSAGFTDVNHVGSVFVYENLGRS